MQLSTNLNSEVNITIMAVSTQVIRPNHRQLLYGVSTRLSQENVKDMMYLAGIEQRLKESISSGTDFFTILEQRGLLGECNYTHLISLLETIGRIDLVKMITSDHQITLVTMLSSDKFSAAKQLAILKRVQILQKKDLYLHSMKKLDLLHNSTIIHQQICDTYILHILSLLQIPEADYDHTPPQPLTKSLAHTLLSSASLFCTSAVSMLKLFPVGEGKEVECLAVLCRQRWNQFCAKVPKDYTPLTRSLQEVHAIDNLGDKLIWQTAKETHKSLQELFSELFGSHDLLTVADTSFSEQIAIAELYRAIVMNLITIIKWLIQLSQAIQAGHINAKCLQDFALILASTYREGIADNADEIATILGLDSLERVLELIPKTTTTLIRDRYQESSQALMSKSIVVLLWSACLVFLVHITTSASPQTEVKSVLPALREVLVAAKEKKYDEVCAYITKKFVSNIKKEARLYKNKCQQVLETMTGQSSRSIDIFRSLFEDS